MNSDPYFDFDWRIRCELVMCDSVFEMLKARVVWYLELSPNLPEKHREAAQLEISRAIHKEIQAELECMPSFVFEEPMTFSTDHGAIFLLWENRSLLIRIYSDRI